MDRFQNKQSKSIHLFFVWGVITSSLKGEHPWERDQIKNSQSLHSCQIQQEESEMLKTHDRQLPNILLSNLKSEMLRK